MPTQHLPTGIDLYYECHGEGEPLVLIPGTGFPADIWRLYQIPELSKSLQVIVFDPRGCGRSTHYQGVYTIEQMAADVIALLYHLHIDAAHVLGHSMGGRIGLSMALDWPGHVKSLIMAASGSGPMARPSSRGLPGLAYDFVRRLRGASFEEHVRHAIKESNNHFTADFRQSHPEVVEAASGVIPLPLGDRAR